METPKRILFVHLLNDYSGSPMVLSQVIKQMVARKHECYVFTNQHKEGYLAGIEGVRYHTFFYRWSCHKIITLFFLMLSQLLLFVKIAFAIKKGTIVYVNTVLPFGASLAGKCFGVKVIYHIHETSIQPKVLKRLLFGIANRTATCAIYVSTYLYKQEALRTPSNHVVYNAISQEFLIHSKEYSSFSKSPVFQVLMLCSLKSYKGVWDFVELALKMPELRFCLVLNASGKDIDTFFSEIELPTNLTIHSAQKNVHPFYAQSHLVINLSHPDKWKETFGMTVIEAMAYGIPAIVPPVGGIAELVEDWVNGFKVSHKNKRQLEDAIRKCSLDPEIYELLALNAIAKVNQFSEKEFASQIASLL